MKKLLLTLALGFSLFTFCNAQYSVLYNFDTTNGINPDGTLTLLGNKLFGTAQLGTVNKMGCIFSVNLNGTGYKDLHDFDTLDGSAPENALTYYGNKLYGMTSYGGANGYGNIFSIDTNGNGYKNLFNFTLSNGGNPYACKLLPSGNKLYGVTYNNTAFSIDTGGTSFKILYTFTGSYGRSPYGSLALSGNKLFGMTNSGGANNGGCIFSIDTGGAGYKDLLDFNNTNGQSPTANSFTISGSTLYGVVTKGGAHDSGRIFSIDTDGTGYADMHDFNGGNGGYPEGGLTLSGNTLWGTTFGGGANSEGVIFSININGSNYVDWFDFTSADGSQLWDVTLTPSGGLLYGAASNGGTNGVGTIFSFNYAGLGINNITASASSINVYPNPSNGVFNIGVRNNPDSYREQGVSEMRVEIYNVLGEQVYNAALKQAEGNNLIDLSSQSAGVYLYRVIANSGELIGEGKLVIEK